MSIMLKYFIANILKHIKTSYISKREGLLELSIFLSVVQYSICSRHSSWENWILMVGMLLVIIGMNTKENPHLLEDWGNGHV